MDLGFSELTDDQLLEMWRQLYGEFSTRLFSTTELAHQVVITEAEKIEAHRQAVQLATQRAKTAYLDALTEEIFDAISEEIRNGTIRIVTPEEEAQKISDADQSARRRALEEAKVARAAMKGYQGDLELYVKIDHARVHVGGRVFTVRLDAAGVARLVQGIQGLI